MLKKILIHCFVATFFCVATNAQSSIQFESLLNDHIGITHSIIYDMDQDAAGNLWMASDAGVIRYNSVFSKTYNKYSGLPKAMGNRTSKLVIDSKNRVWLGGRLGVCLYTPEKDVFESVIPKDLVDPIFVKSIAEDAYGNIWIGAKNGVWKIQETDDGFDFTRFFEGLAVDLIYACKDKNILITANNSIYKLNPRNGKFTEISLKFKGVRVFSLFETETSFLFGTSKDGVFKMDKNLQQVKSIDFKNISLQGYAVRSIIKDAKGYYYVSIDGKGILYLNKDFKVVNYIRHNQNDLNSLPSNSVYEVMIDKENIMWVATYGGGVSFWNNNKSVFKKIQHKINDDNSLFENFTRAICQDENGKVWFGTKDGLSIWDRSKNTWKNLLQGIGLVLALKSDGDYMWVGLYDGAGGLLKININTYQVTKYDSYKKNIFSISKVYAIEKDLDGNIWVGGLYANLVCIAKNGAFKKYPISGIQSILVKQNGDLLLANGAGVYLLSIQDKAIAPIPELQSYSKKFQYLKVTSMREYAKDKILITTNDSGVLFYDAATKKIRVFDQKNGLPTDAVQGGVFLGDGDFWLSTVKGLVHLKTTAKDTLVNIYDKFDGALNTEFNYGSYAKIGKELFFGGIKGVTFFDPKTIETAQRLPVIVFEDFKLFNRTQQVVDKGILKKHINELDEVTLKHNQNSICFQFVGILHDSPSKVKYSWMLEGFDYQWITPQNKTEIGYTNLSPGTYFFKVKAMNKFAKWGATRQIKVTVLEPWWATSNAYFLYANLFLLLLILIVHLTKLSVNKKNAIEQINFFNNLTHELKTPMAILLSSLEGTSKGTVVDTNFKIKKTIKRLNCLFEQILNFQIASTSSKIIQEVSKIDLNHYLKRMIGNLKPLCSERNVTIELENKYPNSEVCLDKEIFNKICYNLLSNAIKYAKENGHIIIELSQQNKGFLSIKIIDDGIGIPTDQQKFILKKYYRARNVVNSQKPGTGLGLMMIKSLIEKTGGNISFSSTEGEGTTFYVELKDQFKEYFKNHVAKESQAIEQKKVENDAFAIRGLREFSDTKILIVEDNDELRNAIVKNLKPYFKIFEATNGQEGFELTQKEIPDLIITDLIMPKMDGLEMCKAIKGDSLLTHIPIFILTVLNNTASKLESFEEGATLYIEKPVDVDVLIAKIVNTLKHQQNLKQKYIHEGDVKVSTHFKNEKDVEFKNRLESVIIDNIKDGSFSVTDLCEEIGYSRTSLYVKLKELIKMSPQDFIIDTKLKHARKLLVKGTMSIKEVAYYSGFSNPKYFSTSFKKRFNMTPSAFVQSLKE